MFEPDGQKKLWANIAGIVIIGLITLLMAFAEIPVILFYLLAMLFVGPVIAVGYFTINIKELKTIRKRELIHLK